MAEAFCSSPLLLGRDLGLALGTAFGTDVDFSDFDTTPALSDFELLLNEPRDARP